MRRILHYIILTIVLISAAAAAKAQSQGTMQFKETIWDFGRINELDPKVSHVFEFTNTGKEPFVIESVVTSCGCTTSEYTRSPVMPGKTGMIKIMFNPDGQEGTVRKEVYVTSDNRRNRATLIVRGDVTPGPRTIEDEYPIQLGNGIRVETVDANHGYIPRGSTKSVVVGYYNGGNTTVSLDIRYDPPAAYFQVFLSERNLKPKEKGVITVTYDLRNTDIWGRVSNRFDLLMDGKKSAMGFSANGIAVEDFSKLTPGQLERAPRGMIPLMYHNFNGVASGSLNKAAFVLMNEGELPLVVRYIKCGDGVSVSNLRAGDTVNSGDRIEFEATLKAEGRSNDKITGELTIILNDPVRPFRELRLAATIR